MVARKHARELGEGLAPEVMVMTSYIFVNKSQTSVVPMGTAMDKGVEYP